MSDVARFEIEEIGRLHCDERYRFEAPRQGVFAQNRGVIELRNEPRFVEAAADLAGFERIWVVFVFHLNAHWNPKVAPPVIQPPGRRVGVFATRSPHRPNRLGMSCVELEAVEGNRLRIRNFDLLDNTPVVDIKPYIPAADAFPEAAAGWVDEAEFSRLTVDFSPRALVKNAFVTAHGGPDIVNFCRVQLCYAPCDRKRKRVRKLESPLWSIGCRTWRAIFSIAEMDSGKRIYVSDIESNYAPGELAPEAPDRYGDLALHRAFGATKF